MNATAIDDGLSLVSEVIDGVLTTTNWAESADVLSPAGFDAVTLHR